jgi:hypothetical protein
MVAAMSIQLALHDARNNCMRAGATATITLRSGVQYSGKLERPEHAPILRKKDGGWVAIDTDEIAAVETTPHG